MLLGIAYMTEFLGQELKPHTINTIDHLLVPWKKSLSLHPGCFEESAENAPRVIEFIAMGDT